MSVKNTNGVKEIDVEEDGKKIHITDDPNNGIKMEIAKKDDKGKETTEKFEAKDADELKKKHPEAHKVYEEYKDQGGAGGAFQIQIQAGGGAVPVPLPIQPGINVGRARGSVDMANVYLKSMMRQLERANTDEAIKEASPEAKQELKKQIDELKKQVAEIEKRLQEDAKKPAEEKPKDKQPEKKPEKASDEAKPAQNAPRANAEPLKPGVKLD